MPTKPVTTFVFATDANFSSGPANGFPTKIVPGSLPQGFVPGTGINAEWSNYLFNLTGQWITDWVSLGTPSADLDAHIVETDSSGMSALASLELGGTASSDLALSVQENTGAISSSIFVENGSGGFAVTASANGASAAIRATHLGAGTVIEGIAFGSGGGGFFDAAGAGDGVIGIGGSTGGTGVIGFASSTGNGGEFQASGSGSAGLFDRQAIGGPAVEALTSGGVPLRGSIFLEPTSEPTAAIDGDLWKRPSAGAGFGRGGFEWNDADGAPGGGGGGTQRAWSTSTGNGRGFNASEGQTTNTTGINTTKVSLGLGAAASPGDPQGVYDISWCATLELPGGVPTTTRGVVEFHGPGGLIDTASFDFTGLGQKKMASGLIQDTLGGGVQTYSIRFRTQNSPDGVVCSRARIRALGAFE